MVPPAPAAPLHLGDVHAQDSDPESWLQRVGVLAMLPQVLEELGVDCFPYWVASLLDRVWLLVAAIAAILLPLTKLVPKYRKLHFAMEVEERYADIRAIEARVLAAASPADLREARTAFDALRRNVAAMWVPTGLTEKYFFLIGAIEPLRARIANAESMQASPRADAAASSTDSRLPTGPVPFEDR